MLKLPLAAFAAGAALLTAGFFSAVQAVSAVGVLCIGGSFLSILVRS